MLPFAMAGVKWKTALSFTKVIRLITAVPEVKHIFQLP